jgi:hypothetical protein
MKRKNIPNQVLDKLLSLSEAAEYLGQKLVTTEEGIAGARARLSGSFRQPEEYEFARVSLQQMLQELPVLKQRAAAAQSVYTACKAWLDHLPTDAVLEPVEVSVDDLDLESIREQIKDVTNELKRLRALPVPDDDIRERVESYVRELGRPQISGVGKGERLKVIWKGSGWNSAGPREDVADPLALAAAIFPNELCAAVMRGVDRMSSDDVPLADRAERIAELENEISELRYSEEVLLADGDADMRFADAPPAAVLGVRVTESISRAA